MAGDTLTELVTRLFEATPRKTRQDIVRLVVEELGFSKSEVARMMGVTPSAITRFMRGDAAPSPTSLARLFLSLEPEERSSVLSLILAHLTTVLRNARMLVERGLVDTNDRFLELQVEELIDTAMRLLEPTGGYRGAHSSSARLGERYSSEPPVGSESSSRVRRRL